MLGWLHGPSARLLAQLAVSGQPITHAAVDGLPGATHHIRKLLVHAGVVPVRNEHLESLGRWCEELLEHAPAHHRRILRPYIHWGVLRPARRADAHGRYTAGSAKTDRSQISANSHLLRWIDEQHVDFAELTQAHLDRWIIDNSNRASRVRGFLRWAAARRLCPVLHAPYRPRSEPTLFLDEQDRIDQLNRCITDEALPVDVRVAGALVLLFGVRITTLVELTHENVIFDDNGTSLVLNTEPIMLPPQLARLVERQVTAPRVWSGIKPPDTVEQYLFPGKPASRPVRPHTLSNRLNDHGIRSLPARNTALLTLASDLPAAVVAELFGLHITTAIQWNRYAQRDWVDYLIERSTDTGVRK